MDLQAFYERRKRLEADWGEHALSHASDMSFADYAVMRLMQAEAQIASREELAQHLSDIVESNKDSFSIIKQAIEAANYVAALNVLDMVESEAE